MFDIADKYCFYLDKDSNKDRELFLLLLSLEKYVNGAIIEIKRLERTRRSITKKLSMSGHGIERTRAKDFQLTYLACDTHFYFICIDKCYKLLTQLSLELDDKEIKKLKTKLNKAYDITTVRNHLEHIEDRCRGYLTPKQKKRDVKNLISDFGNYAGDYFSFNNKMFPSGRNSLEELKNIYRDLISILDERARKNPEFVKQIERDEQINFIRKTLKKAKGNIKV